MISPMVGVCCCQRGSWRSMSQSLILHPRQVLYFETGFCDLFCLLSWIVAFCYSKKALMIISESQAVVELVVDCCFWAGAFKIWNQSLESKHQFHIVRGRHNIEYERWALCEWPRCRWELKFLCSCWCFLSITFHRSCGDAKRLFPSPPKNPDIGRSA